MIRTGSGVDTALLVLEDGSIFTGAGLRKRGLTGGEVVFNTAFTGYEEILTDPSYRQQIICMAFPAIGNYGFSKAFLESDAVQVSGFIVGDAAPGVVVGGEDLDAYLAARGIVGINKVDTRAMVRKVRSRGAMRGLIASDPSLVSDREALVARAKSLPPMSGSDLVTDWTRAGANVSNPEGRIRIGLLDCGAKQGIIEDLVRRDCRVELLRHDFKASEVIASKLDGVLLSNGPGDPSVLTGIVGEVRQLIGKIPMMGICLGHQILGQAAGGRTYKLPFGHRGANHPVINLDSRMISITSQNHGFAVDPKSLPEGTRETEKNLYDGTNEGIEVVGKRAFSVQYHPEARPGPLDAAPIFDRFLKMVKS